MWLRTVEGWWPESCIRDWELGPEAENGSGLTLKAGSARGGWGGGLQQHAAATRALPWLLRSIPGVAEALVAGLT